MIRHDGMLPDSAIWRKTYKLYAMATVGHATARIAAR